MQVKLHVAADPLARRKIPRHMEGCSNRNASKETRRRIVGKLFEGRVTDFYFHLPDHQNWKLFRFSEGTIGKLLRRRIRFASKRERINISSRNKSLKNIFGYFFSSKNSVIHIGTRKWKNIFGNNFAKWK